MRRFLTIGLLTTITVLTTVPTVAAQNGTSSDEVLTNEKVITMVKAGLSSGIIVNKIRSSNNNFDTSTGELIRLQQVRVPTEIINATVEAAIAKDDVSAPSKSGDSSRVQLLMELQK